MRDETATARALRRTMAQLEGGGTHLPDAPITDEIVYLGSIEMGHLTCRVDGYRRALCADRDGHPVPAWALIEGLVGPCGNCTRIADARELDVPRRYVLYVQGRDYGLEVGR